MYPLILTLLFVSFIGLVFGSFISAITHRIPLNEDFIKGRSYCDNCNKSLRWSDNIPLLSYFWLKGKSSCCNKPISVRYPLIEIASSIGAVILYALLPFPTFVIYYLLYLLSLAILVIDLEHQIIPDELVLIIFILGLLFKYNVLYLSLFSGFFCASLLLLLYVFTKGRGMGLGDVKLAVALGVWLNLTSGMAWLMTSFIIGGLVATILLVSRKANMKTKIAFGPFLVIAFWITQLIQ